MKYKVAIRKNETGEIRMYDGGGEWGGSSHFLWTDGNYACDCNRADFFGDEDAAQCGETIFAALYAEMEDGSRIALDCRDTKSI